jgi:cation:H+ antiporter
MLAAAVQTNSNAGWIALLYLGLFVVASLVMVWRLECMMANGLEGTVLGTLVMPYCSGLGNLIFALLVGARRQSGAEVVINSLVNNLTNMTLLIGLPAIFWGMSVVPKAKGKKKKTADDPRLNRLSMLLTLTAVLFFTGATWALSRDGRFDLGDGLVLVGLFLFWQCFHIFDVLKANARQNKVLKLALLLDLLVLAVGAYGIYVSVEWLVNWLGSIKTGFLSASKMGWLTGWLMVLPNGILALYYGWKRRPDVVYTSQVGDGHICIPLCIGVAALFRDVPVPPVFDLGTTLLVGATVVHFLVVLLFGQLPRFMGWVFLTAYAVFLLKGLSDHVG